MAMSVDTFVGPIDVGPVTTVAPVKCMVVIYQGLCMCYGLIECSNMTQ